jgi:hypothetical protein
MHLKSPHPPPRPPFSNAPTPLVAIVGFIELRDRFEYRRTNEIGTSTTSTAPDRVIGSITPNGAQLVAMVENAKSSTWRDNLTNASDAQRRFMLPPGMRGGADDDDGDGDATPEYVRKIDARSREIMRDERIRREEERKMEDDPTRTRFWR